MSKILGISIFSLVVLLVILLVVLLISLSAKFLKDNKFFKKFIISFLYIGLILFLSTNFFWNSAPKFFHELGFAWLIFIPFYTITLLISYLARIFTKNRFIINSIFYISLSASIAVLFIGREHYSYIKTTNHVFNVSDSVGTNERVLLATDLHLSNYINDKDLTKIISKINAQNPDIVIFGW